MRVARGSRHESELSPSSGYQYAGLYTIARAWQELSPWRYRICRFQLVYAGSDPRRKNIAGIELDHAVKEKRRRASTVVRIVRDTKLSRELKRLYGYSCQVCGLKIATKRGLYAEGAHIKPLGNPHAGDDSLSNCVSLSEPHVMFDKGPSQFRMT